MGLDRALAIWFFVYAGVFTLMYFFTARWPAFGFGAAGMALFCAGLSFYFWSHYRRTTRATVSPWSWADK